VLKQVLLPLIVLAAPFLGCGHTDSIGACTSDSREAIFARSLSKSQLEALYAESMKLLARADLQKTYRNDTRYPPIPDQFAYLNPGQIETFTSDVEGVDSYVSFILKGCFQQDIELSVAKDDIVLAYARGGASNANAEVLWSANQKQPQK
jgi:hypothetical protein